MGKIAGLVVVVLVIGFISCRGGSTGTPGGEARIMRLTSDVTEIAIASNKVPGYWARQEGGDAFFLFTKQTPFRKGETLKVVGAYGSAEAAVFEEETRVYQSARPTLIFVVWKATPLGPERTARPEASKVPGE